jgi:hypothetical protein
VEARSHQSHTNWQYSSLNWRSPQNEKSDPVGFGKIHDAELPTARNIAGVLPATSQGVVDARTWSKQGLHVSCNLTSTVYKPPADIQPLLR